MRHLLGSTIVVTVICLLPSVFSERGKNVERKLAVGRQSEGGDLFPGKVFQEDQATDLTEKVTMWRTSPRAYLAKNKGKGKGSSEWSWKSAYDPCKGSKKGGKSGGKSKGYPSTYSPTAAPSVYECDEGEDGDESPVSSPGGQPDGGYPDSGYPDNGYPDGGDGGSEGGDGSSGGDGSGGDGSGGDGSGSDGSGGDGSGGDGSDPVTCSAIETGPRPDAAEGDTEAIYGVSIDLEYERPPLLREGVQAIFDQVGPILDLWVAGCEDRAKELATELRDQTRSGRRLQEGSISWVDSSYAAEGPDPCTSVIEGGTCQDTFTADFDVISNDVPSSEIRSRIAEAFLEFGDLIASVGQNKLTIGSVSVGDGSDPNGANRGPPPVEEDSLSTAMVIAASAGGLAFILLVVLLARRNNPSDDQLSHLKLEEDGDDAFIQEIASTASSVSRDYETRNVHVVGEADSIFSGWTGYTKNGRPDGYPADEFGDGYHSDVHKCSSATCEVCELRRQQGIQFIPTTSPARPQLPIDTDREYVADDTVEL